jgi:hypothetical protein
MASVKQEWHFRVCCPLPSVFFSPCYLLTAVGPVRNCEKAEAVYA